MTVHSDLDPGVVLYRLAHAHLERLPDSGSPAQRACARCHLRQCKLHSAGLVAVHCFFDRRANSDCGGRAAKPPDLDTRGRAFAGRLRRSHYQPGEHGPGWRRSALSPGAAYRGADLDRRARRDHHFSLLRPAGDGDCRPG